MTDDRPEPDDLLAQAHEAERAARRGHLKIFFGASAGVGKTCAMLAQAQAQLEHGVDVVIGVVETHGRADTAALVGATPAIPRRDLLHHGRTLPEFDLDAVLERRPALVLVDELAHSNVAGSRHLKRWQDVEELLANGIDVWTTMNVQHLESLNDVVNAVAGVRVWETVPDHVFDDADDVVLVDLPLLRFDAVLIERVLANLLENAAKYTPQGSAISVGAAATRHAVEVWVTDEGPGLPPGREELIFEKFERGHKESATPGVGLGLAICRAIVLAHGGEIRGETIVAPHRGADDGETRPEGGARFVFTLPRGEPPRIEEPGDDADNAAMESTQ